MNLDVGYHCDLLIVPNRDDNSHLFQRSNSISRINNDWSFANEEICAGSHYALESNSNYHQILDNDSNHCGAGILQKTWSTPYLNNNEESKDIEENDNEHYFNLMNVSNPWPSNTILSNTTSVNVSSHTTNSNSLLKDAINNNIEKSWLMSLKGLSKKQIKSDAIESYKNNDNELIQNNVKQTKNDNAFHSEERISDFLNLDKELENVRERKISNSSQRSFLLSTNLESLSPITISLNELSFGGSLVSPSFPSDKFVYLDSPIRITIMGSHQVGKSALAVRYLSRQESSHRYSTASRAFSPTMHANEICEIENSWSQKLMLDPEELSILSRSISVELEIIDTSSNSKVTKFIEPGRETKIQCDNLSTKFQPNFWNANIDTADAIVVMYSVTDRTSFHVARETLDWLAMEFNSDDKSNVFPPTDSKVWHPPVTCPVLLLANKADLNHLRQVSLSEGRDLAGQFNSANFFEVSVADSPFESVSILEKVVRDIIRMKKDSLYARASKKKSSSSNSSKTDNRRKSPQKQLENLLGSNRRRPTLLKSQSGIFESEKSNTMNYSSSNRKSKIQNGYTSFGSSNTVVSDFRSRKLGVINAACSRMLNNLIGRNSMPPDLPTNNPGSPPGSSSNSSMFSFSVGDTSKEHSGVPNNQLPCSSTPSSPTGLNPKPDSFSFRRVFKKRSV